MKTVKISNMTNARGNLVPNQFLISVGNDIYFQSYQTIIAKKSKGVVTLDKNSWDYSKTTGKYRNYFLNEEKKDTLRKIKEGIYKLKNLN